jgi:hypothetical protein
MMSHHVEFDVSQYCGCFVGQRGPHAAIQRHRRNLARSPWCFASARNDVLGLSGLVSFFLLKEELIRFFIVIEQLGEAGPADQGA